MTGLKIRKKMCGGNGWCLKDDCGYWHRRTERDAVCIPYLFNWTAVTFGLCCGPKLKHQNTPMPNDISVSLYLCLCSTESETLTPSLWQNRLNRVCIK